MHSSVTPPNACPICGTVNDRATACDGEQITPGKGDLSVCNTCGTIVFFTDDEGHVKLAEIDELRSFQKQYPDLWEVADRVSRHCRKRYLKGMMR